MEIFDFGEGITAQAEYDEHAGAMRVEFEGLSQPLSFYLDDSPLYDPEAEIYDLRELIWLQADRKLYKFIHDCEARGILYLDDGDSKQ